MRIATFNVNGIRSRLPRLLEWLAEAAPDVACLQELKAADDAFPEAAIREAGYHPLWHGQKGFNGVAILARDAAPVELQRGLPGDNADEQSRYLEARVGDVVVASIYLPNGNPQPGPKFDYKLAWFDRLIAHTQRHAASGTPVVLAGDYNVVPTDDVSDIFSAEAFRDDALLHPDSRAAWQRLLGCGWTDAIRHLHPNETIYTYWDYFRNRWARNNGMRIDHLLLNAPARERLAAAGVDREVRGRDKPSDHAPTWVELGRK